MKPAGRLDWIEAARGVAASAVVLYHTGRHLNHAAVPALASGAFQFGHAGVDLFFVLSGFIIWFVHAGDIGRPARLGHYLRRRVTRVYPLYWLALLATMAMSALGSHGLPSVGQALRSALLVPWGGEPLLGVAWTLQHEVVFYALFCTLILHRALGLAAFAVWLLIIAVGLAGGAAGLPPALRSPYDLEFFLGMAAAVMVRRGTRLRAGWLLTAGLALFALAATAEDLGGLNGAAFLARLAYGLPSLLIVAGAAGLRHRPPPRALALAGAASYSIYLFQFLFIGVVWQLLGRAALAGRMPLPVIFTALALPAILGGVAIGRWLEQPLLRGLRRLAAGPAQPV